MHILIIPSEEFVPAENPLAGIFQYHQAAILRQVGNKVGVLSIKQSYSIPMLIKAVLFKMTGRRINNPASNLSIKELIVLGYNKMFRQTAFLREQDLEGIKVFRIDGFYYLKPSIQNSRMGWVKAGLVAYDEYVKQYGRPDVIHAHNAIYAGILAMKLKKKKGIPYVITEHSTAFARKIISHQGVLDYARRAYLNSKQAFAVSIPFCQLLEKSFPGNSFSYLPNVIDPHLEDRTLVIPADCSKEFIFLNIAELHPKKNQKLLVDSFAKLKTELPTRSMKLLIAGEGELRDTLARYIEERGMSGHVHLIGYLSRTEVFNELSKCSCFVLSSEFETFGVVLIEAMLLGKPVISTKSGGPEGFLNEKVGLLVDKSDPGQLSSAMRRVMESYGSYDQTMIRDYAIREFGRNSFARRAMAIYTQLEVK